MHISDTDEHLWAVILAGGIGTRFWPVSTPTRPKQFLPLGSESPLIRDTIERILPLIPRERIRILTGERLATLALESVPTLSTDNLLVEPIARGTAPVLVWAAFELMKRDPDALMISLHADHMITPGDEFRSLLAALGRSPAIGDHLMTIGVEPTRPETGYGYIRVGPRIGDAPELYQVSEFVEKPDHESAEGYLQTGGYLWNSGIFVWRAETLLQEIRAHTPELARLLPHLEDGNTAAFFEASPNLSIDEGLLERSDRVVVARATFEWDDVGAWEAVARSRSTDDQGNVTIGDVHLVESSGCIAWAETGTIVLFGTTDLVVVQAGEVSFVAPRARTAELKELLRRLPDRLTGGEG